MSQITQDLAVRLELVALLLKRIRALNASCAVCSSTRNLTSHHIHPKEYRESYPNGAENINERANLVILCAGCHSAVHDRRSFEQIIRDIRTKLRRKIKERKPRLSAGYDTPELEQQAKEQSLKDQQIQRLVWKQLIETLQNKETKAKIEEYRRIIRLIGRIHRAIDDFEDNKFG